MGHGQRTQKTKPLLGAAKNHYTFLVSLIIGSIFAGSLSSCTAKSKNSEGATRVSGDLASSQLSGQVLTKTGANESPDWSPDGRKFIFTSHLRAAHSNWQIYEWDLSAGSERRVTFSDGDSVSPHYLQDGDRIIYASTTDELKERPLLLQKKNETANSTRPPSDLYLSRLNGLDIVRITNRSGFDGLIRTAGGNKNEFYYSSEIGTNLAIFKVHSNLKSVSSIFADSKEDRRDFVYLNNRSAWIATYLEQEPGALTPPVLKQQLMVATASIKKAQAVDFGMILYKDLSWIPGVKKGEEILLFTGLLAGKSNSQIYIFDPTKNCLVTLIKSENAALSQASISPDRERVLYVRSPPGENSQILIKKIEWDKVICEEGPIS
jgi:Tol biopolymer transport system component